MFIFQSPLFVGVMFTLSVSSCFVQNVYSMPLTDKTNELSPNVRQHFVKISPVDQIVLRLAALFLGLFLIFAMLICLCSMYWCASWTMQLQWPIAGFVWSRVVPERFLTSTRNSSQTSSCGKDLPPPYDVVLAHMKDEVASISCTQEFPPSYREALLLNHNGAT